MACNEIDLAFTWAKSASGTETHPVTAYFTKHEGVFSDTKAPVRDYCWYAAGAVKLNASGHLAGDLDLYINDGPGTKAQPGGESMQLPAKSTLGLEIFPDDTFSYQQKLHGDPVGGAPPVKINTTTCVGGVLLMATEKDAVVAVGVRRDPPLSVPK
jgi:hypothetical protein